MSRNEIKRTIVTSNITCVVYDKSQDATVSVVVTMKASEAQGESLEKNVKKELHPDFVLLKIDKVENTQKTYIISTEAFIAAAESYMASIEKK